MATRLVRTMSGGSFAAEVTPADVVDRCTRCRVTFREGDQYCTHLAGDRGHAIARIDIAEPAPATTMGAPRSPFVPVFLAPGA